MVMGLGIGNADVLSANNTEIRLVAVVGPYNASGSIVVTADTGATISKQNVWTHLEQGCVCCHGCVVFAFVRVFMCAY